MMASSNGWKQPAIPDEAQLEQWLGLIKKNEEHLDAFMQQVQPNRLGLYYEYLLRFFFEAHPDYKLLMHNHPVFQARRTMGAFDFIYKNKSNQIIHRESAVKFYLGVPNGHDGEYSDWSQWWGPNKVDRLDKKLTRLMEHQIKLSDTQEALNLFEKENIHIDGKEIDLKGYLCYPYHENMPPPKGINPNHLRASWLSIDNIDALPKRNHWDILSRLRWLSPVSLNEKPKYTTSTLIKTLNNHFKATKSPVLIVRLKKHNNQYFEAERFFITPSSWREKEGNDDAN